MGSSHETLKFGYYKLINNIEMILYLFYMIFVVLRLQDLSYIMIPRINVFYVDYEDIYFIYLMFSHDMRE